METIDLSILSVDPKVQKVNRVIWRGSYPLILLGTVTYGSFFEKYFTIEFEDSYRETSVKATSELFFTKKRSQITELLRLL